MSPLHEENRKLRSVAASLAVVVFIGIAVQSIVFGLLLRQNDRLSVLAKEAKLTAAAAADASRGNRLLLERNNPCLEGDPPESAPCVRQREADKIIADAVRNISERVIAAVAAQHTNVAAQHEAIVREIRAAFNDPSIRGALRGERGPAGPQGPTGPQGPQGLPGGIVAQQPSTLPTVPTTLPGLLDRVAPRP